MGIDPILCLGKRDQSQKSLVLWEIQWIRGNLSSLHRYMIFMFMCLKEGRYQYSDICYASDVIEYDRRIPELRCQQYRKKDPKISILDLDLPGERLIARVP